MSHFTSLSRNLTALIAAVLVATTFVAAAAGPALVVTPTINSDIVA